MEQVLRLAKVGSMSHEVRSDRIDAITNRRRIVDVAGEAFAREGLDVPIREIARRAGLGIATVYRHFPSKDSLVSEVFDEQLASCRVLIDEGLHAEDPGDGFRMVLQRLMAMQARDRGFGRAFLSKPSGASSFNAERDHSFEMMSRLLERARSAGSIRSDLSVDDVILALMANDGIRSETAEARMAASRRLSALLIQAFSANQPVSADGLRRSRAQEHADLASRRD